MRRYQLGLLIALSLGMTGCQSSSSSTASSWNPTTWNWNPWASKDTAVAKSDTTAPILPSAGVNNTPASTAVASRNAPAATGPTSYPTTGAPVPNFAVAQNGAYPTQPTSGYPIAPAGAYPAQPAGGYAAQPAPSYGAQSAYGTTPATGGYPNTTVPAGYMSNGYGNYGQAAAPATPAAPPAYGTAPAVGYGAAPPATGMTPTYGTTPAYGTTPSAYGQQPNPGNNPYAQPPAQPGAMPGYGQGAAADPNNPSNAFGAGGFAGGMNQQAAALPERNTAPYMPGSIKPMSGTSNEVTQAAFDAKPGENSATTANGYGNPPAGTTCANGTCYPSSSTTTSAPAGYQQPAAAQGGYNFANPAPATTASPSFYR